MARHERRPAPRHSRAPLIGAATAMLAATLLAGCAERPATYGAQLSQNTPFEFTEERSDPARFRDVPSGGDADQQRLHDLLLYRAAEVTLQNGMEGFRIVEESTNPDTRRKTGFTGGGGYGTAPGYAFSPTPWHRATSLAGPRGDNGSAIQRYKSFARIQMFRQAPETSGDDGVYDARAVLAELQPDASTAEVASE